ncbi:hypothetical protein KUL150_22040 [Alteromonas sp. KUL150]|uniref:winged helix-turn-helix domain-containing protein n=1 Tax=Alteromonas sp. KUL150 TaxID=2480805 RepID=UPI0012E489E8|nr:winged helix-turn-helix domain-containing protein [Alteromonas sp. KUL150]GFD86145.1 hypothetical protein KUL150_22040 [Alteromonas sp. KUL150]
MPSLYTHFSPDTGEVTIGETTKTLRPKTFQLAQYLASHTNEVVSKEALLSAIWSDSVVEDQAVFQSVNEIRKAFAPHQVIRTYPRRGYVWLIDCPAPSVEQEVSSDDVKSAPDVVEKAQAMKWRLPKAILFLVAIAVVLVTLLSSQNGAGDRVDDLEVAHHALLVLPFDTSHLDAQMRWLRFGAMDAVIRQFHNQTDLTVFQPDDTLDILTRKQPGQNSADDLFGVSGASLIIDGKFSGVPGEYTLTYIIFERQSRQHGVLHGKTTDQLLTGLVAELQSRFKLSPSQRDISFETQFNNTLMFNAMQLMAAGDIVSAASFLQSAIIAMPEQPDAYYWLARARLLEGNIDEALASVNRMLSLDNTHRSDALFSRALYLKASALLALQDANAYAALNDAFNSARENEDWLYVAYSNSMLGHYYLSVGNAEQAKSHFSNAMTYQQMLNCPLGVTQGYLDWADYYLATGNTVQARLSLSKAEELIQNKGLSKALPLLKQKQQKL